MASGRYAARLVRYDLIFAVSKASPMRGKHGVIRRHVCVALWHPAENVNTLTTASTAYTRLGLLVYTAIPYAYIVSIHRSNLRACVAKPLTCAIESSTVPLTGGVASNVKPSEAATAEV